MATDFQKKIAEKTANIIAVANKPKIHIYDDDKKLISIPIMSAQDQPRAGLTTFATIGLSASDNVLRGATLASVEFIGVCFSEFEEFPNAIAAAAFSLIRSGWGCAPGIILPGALKIHGCTGMTDLYFLPPIFWGDSFDAISLEDRLVAWLMAVPITSSEREFAVKNGPLELEKLLEAGKVDIANLERKSVV